MGAYRAAVVTAGGENLIAQALADNMALEFTSAKTSSYAYPSGTNIAALTGLQDVEQSVIPSASQVINSNVAQISVRFDNNEVTQTYLIQTIGLYAKVGNGSETLFSVIRAITPDEMPVQSATSPSAFIYNIQHTIQNAAQITMVVNPAGTATVQDILNIENPTFDDSGEVEGISSFPDFLGSVVNKMSLFQFFRNLKAGMGYVLHMGKLVNNGLCDTPGQFALDAAYGKNLQDQLTKLNSDFRTLYFIERSSSITFEISGGGIALCFISFPYETSRYFAVIFWGQGGQQNASQKIVISLLVGNDSTDVTFIPINQYGKYNQFVISNNIMGYGIDVCFVSIYGDITSIF